MVYNVLLTDIGYLISHHVFIVVDSGVWNISLLAHRHNEQFLKVKRKRIETRKIIGDNMRGSYYLDTDSMLMVVQCS